MVTELGKKIQEQESFIMKLEMEIKTHAVFLARAGEGTGKIREKGKRTRKGSEQGVIHSIYSHSKPSQRGHDRY